MSEKRPSVRAIFMSACEPNYPGIVMRRRRCSGEIAARASHISVMHLEVILIVGVE